MSGTGQQQLHPHASNPVVAKALWDHIGEMAKFTSQVQADYGKWLLVTVTSVHLAALYLVSQDGVPEAVRTNAWSYWPFIIGICAILISGLVTWANWGLSAATYIGWRHPFMLVDPAFWPKETPRWKKIVHPLTFWGALAIGVFSAACLPWGACEIFANMPQKATVIEPAPPPAPAATSTPQQAKPPARADFPTPPAVNKGEK